MKYQNCINYFNYSLFLTVLLILSSTVYGQKMTGCNLNNGRYDCSVSFSLLEEPFWAWEVNSVEKQYLEEEFKKFSNVWCEITKGHSRIQRIYIYTGGRINRADANLYKTAKIKRDGSGTANFNFPKPKGSMTFRGSWVYNDGSTDKKDKELGELIAHEFGHAGLKLFDEYQLPKSRESSKDPCQPRHDDNQLNTLMSDHRPDNHNRLSNASDYIDILTRIRNLFSTFLPLGDIETAQRRCAGTAAWDQLLRDDNCTKHEDKYKIKPNDWHKQQTGIFYDLYKGNSCFPTTEVMFENGPPQHSQSCASISDSNIVWVPSSLERNLAMIIDESGSMSVNNRLVRAKSIASQVVDAFSAEKDAGMIKMAVIGFDDSAIIDIGLTNVKSQGSSIKSAINGLVAGGENDFEDALLKTQTVFSSEINMENKQNSAILISDGEPSASDKSDIPTEQTLRYFLDNNIPIYTIGVGDDVGRDFLAGISESTKGDSFSGSINQLSSFVRDVLTSSNFVQNDQTVRLSSLSLQNYLITTTLTSVISPGTNSVSFILRWDNRAIFTDMILKQPDGIIVDSNYANTTDTVRYSEGASQAIYSIDSPMEGNWEIHIRGSGDFEYEMTVDNNVIAADIQVPPNNIVYPEPIPFLVNVYGYRPVVNAEVIAKITMPDSTTKTVVLIDNGNTIDEQANDGMYSGVMNQYSQNGTYDIEAIISNVDGGAKFDDSATAFSINAAPSTPTAAPRFQRIVRAQIEVTGVPTRDTEPQDSDDAAYAAEIINPDGTLYWGMITTSDQINYHRFMAVEGTQYFIETSNLLGDGNITMITAVKLYDTTDEFDGVNDDDDDDMDNGVDANMDGLDDDDFILIETSTGDQNMPVSSIQWTAPKNAHYLISVAHANQGTGTYGLTVSERRRVDNAMQQPGGGSSGGGSSDYILLLLLLLMLAVILHKNSISKRSIVR